LFFRFGFLLLAARRSENYSSVRVKATTRTDEFSDIVPKPRSQGVSAAQKTALDPHSPAERAMRDRKFLNCCKVFHCHFDTRSQVFDSL
ncbi:hypothetical protein, partial [Pseudomonas chlororaphis]|uniref:hypothetical protein n=1 Tax=Pseudomonas chlororaphis TaxID=587753 RepID=UPI001C82D69F